MVEDLISRQDAINLLNKWSGGYDYIETETESAIKEFQHLSSAQTVGKWLEDGECSVCGHCDWDCLESKTFKYCPNCGAKME